MSDLCQGTLKMRDQKMRDQYAGVENAGNDIIWNTVYSLRLFSPARYDH